MRLQLSIYWTLVHNYLQSLASIPLANNCLVLIMQFIAMNDICLCHCDVIETIIVQPT